jgi:hypothetical protein
MTREELREYIGKKVSITFCDGHKAEGILEYISEFCEAQGWRKPGYYAVGHWNFKCSHVKKLKMLS